jgi:hypothetical protein
MNRNWIEQVLERELRPVAAPRELWDRVQEPRRAPVMRWKLAFVLMAAVATAWALHPRTSSIESDRAGEIREWVKARTGLDVPLAPLATVKLCGARTFGNSAEIRFRVENRDVVVSITKAERFTGSHEFNGSSWIWRGIAFTGDRNACLLCHS